MSVTKSFRYKKLQSQELSYVMLSKTKPLFESYEELYDSLEEALLGNLPQ